MADGASSARRVDLSVQLLADLFLDGTRSKGEPVTWEGYARRLQRRLVARHPEGPIFRNLRGRPWTRNAMACNFARVREDLGHGVEVTACAFRHRYGTDALLGGQEVATVATVLGHKSTTMVMRHYSHLEAEHAHLMKAALAIRPAATPGDGRASGQPGADREPNPKG